ncbi:multicopper oxidase domain-containing protein [Fodinisporobacter ferrooxydans]
MAGSLLAGCGIQSAPPDKSAPAPTAQTAKDTKNPQQAVNQPPTPVVVKRIGAHDVQIEMTAQETDVEIAPGVKYHSWNFNGTVPGPVIKVKQGDTIHFKLKNMDPKIPHSMDFHAVTAAPNKDFANVAPNKEGEFTYTAENPGVFMYHCGTAPVLMHIANGMYGTILVQPKDGYPTDKRINKEFVITESEVYKQNDFNDMKNGSPSYVLFNGKTTEANKPLYAKVGDWVRIYFNNVGPNDVSSFHVVGTQFDTVYVDGNPQNVLHGLQSYAVPASGGLVVEFQVKKEGIYPIVDHEFSKATKGAIMKLVVTKDGNPPQQ